MISNDPSNSNDSVSGIESVSIPAIQMTHLERPSLNRVRSNANDPSDSSDSNDSL